MKLLVALAVCVLAAGSAWAVEIYRYATEAQLLTRSSPEVDAPLASEKINLDGVKKVRATACTCTTSDCSARDGYHFTGGKFDVWYQKPDGGWAENVDLRLSAGGLDGGCQTWADIPSPGGNVGGLGRTTHMMIRASAVTKLYTDAGAYVKVELEGIANE